MVQTTLYLRLRCTQFLLGAVVAGFGDAVVGAGSGVASLATGAVVVGAGLGVLVVVAGTGTGAGAGAGVTAGELPPEPPLR